MEKKVPVMGCIMLWILLLGKKKKQQHIHTKTYNRKFCFKQNKSL